MEPATWTFTAGIAWAGAGIAWLLLDNLQALARHRRSLRPGRASKASIVAWLLSVLAVWMGPLMPVAAGAALAMGFLSRRAVLRGEEGPRSELPARMAMRNATIVGAVFLGVMLCLYFGWRLHPSP